MSNTFFSDTPRQKSAELTDAEKFFMFCVINKDSSNINSFVEEADPVCGLLTGSRELQRAASDFKRKENMDELDQLRSRYEQCMHAIRSFDSYIFFLQVICSIVLKIISKQQMISFIFILLIPMYCEEIIIRILSFKRM